MGWGEALSFDIGRGEALSFVPNRLATLIT